MTTRSLMRSPKLQIPSLLSTGIASIQAIIVTSLHARERACTAPAANPAPPHPSSTSVADQCAWLMRRYSMYIAANGVIPLNGPACQPQTHLSARKARIRNCGHVSGNLKSDALHDACVSVWTVHAACGRRCLCKSLMSGGAWGEKLPARSRARCSRRPPAGPILGPPHAKSAPKIETLPQTGKT
eukprot:3511857-Rhodomonas_salina.2